MFLVLKSYWTRTEMPKKDEAEQERGPLLSGHLPFPPPPRLPLLLWRKNLIYHITAFTFQNIHFGIWHFQIEISILGRQGRRGKGDNLTRVAIHLGFYLFTVDVLWYILFN